MIENITIYLLLFLAVVAGWTFGRLNNKKNRNKSGNSDSIFTDYFVGLNYLLNDEPDEAIDTFIKALEINSDTVETHLALGALLRRRGKVDKAIKVHQALLARQGLDKQFFDSTRFQLALDYIAAGLLDRAERLLKEIEQEAGSMCDEALQQLTTIYQTEKEWNSALAAVQSLLRLRLAKYKKDTSLRSIAAHYCCELAEELLQQNQLNRAREQIKAAFTFDRKHVRASLLLAQLEQRIGNTQTAIKELLRVRNNHPQFSSHVLATLVDWDKSNLLEYELEAILSEQLATNADRYLVVHLADQIQANRGNSEAIDFLEKYQDRYPSLNGLVSLLRMHLVNAEGPIANDLARLENRLNAQLHKQYSYQCNHCGYESRNLYWLCPGCQKWDKTGPRVNDLL